LSTKWTDSERKAGQGRKKGKPFRKATLSGVRHRRAKTSNESRMTQIKEKMLKNCCIKSRQHGRERKDAWRGARKASEKNTLRGLLAVFGRWEAGGGIAPLQGKRAAERAGKGRGGKTRARKILFTKPLVSGADRVKA